MEVVKRICDQVAVIDKGRLIEQGTVSEISLIRKQNWLKSLSVRPSTLRCRKNI